MVLTSGGTLQTWRRACKFARPDQVAAYFAGRSNCRHPSADQFSCQCGQSVVMAVRPPVFGA
jgi:hypothetical protein